MPRPRTITKTSSPTRKRNKSGTRDLPSHTEHHRLYSDLARYWPIVSPPEDYAPEAESVRRLLARASPSLFSRTRHIRPTLLELGAGGGHLIHHLTPSFDITAVDLSAPMLKHSRRLNPTVTHHVGDMRTARLGRTFNAVLVHDALAYMLTRGDLLKLFRTAKRHIKPDGLLVLMPDYLTENFPGHDLSHDHHTTRDEDITTVSLAHDPDPRDTTFELVMTFIIRKRGGEKSRRVASPKIIVDRHTCGLFPLSVWQRGLDACGFTSQMHTAGTSGLWHPCDTKKSQRFHNQERVLFLARLK